MMSVLFSEGGAVDGIKKILGLLSGMFEALQLYLLNLCGCFFLNGNSGKQMVDIG